MNIRLPDLDSIIHHLENFESTEAMCLNVEDGTLQAEKLLEAQPELLGRKIFLLPEWSSAQGYDLMLRFARRELDEELLRILHGRRHVFKKFRSYMKEQEKLKAGWLDFKRAHFYQYLETWFREQFPEVLALQTALQKWLADPPAPLEEDITEELLAEDFVLVEKFKESKEQYLAHPLQVKVLRGFTAMENYLPVSAPNKILRDYLEALDWINSLELHDPAGVCAAQLFWCWREEHIQVLQIYSDYKVLNTAILKKYLLESFLHNICPKLDTPQVGIFIQNGLETVLEAFATQTLGKYTGVSPH